MQKQRLPFGEVAGSSPTPKASARDRGRKRWLSLFLSVIHWLLPRSRVASASKRGCPDQVPAAPAFGRGGGAGGNEDLVSCINRVVQLLQLVEEISNGCP